MPDTPQPPATLAEAVQQVIDAYDAPPMETALVSVPRAALRLVLKSFEPAGSDD